MCVSCLLVLTELSLLQKKIAAVKFDGAPQQYCTAVAVAAAPAIHIVFNSNFPFICVQLLWRPCQQSIHVVSESFDETKINIIIFTHSHFWALLGFSFSANFYYFTRNSKNINTEQNINIEIDIKSISRLYLIKIENSSHDVCLLVCMCAWRIHHTMRHVQFSTTEQQQLPTGVCAQSSNYLNWISYIHIHWVGQNVYTINTMYIVHTFPLCSIKSFTRWIELHFVKSNANDSDWKWKIATTTRI